MKGLKSLSDSLLIEAYNQALKLSLSKEFAEILKNEAIRRNIKPYIHTQKQ